MEISNLKRILSLEDNYKIIKNLGCGTFGSVKLAVHKLTNEYVAIKILEKSKINSKEDKLRTIRELNLLPNIKSNFCLSCFELLEDNFNYYIVSEYLEGGELFSLIVDIKRLDESTSSLYFFQIVEGLNHLHINHNIVHRDIKPENLLLNFNKKILKIIDFGLSNNFSYLNGSIKNTNIENTYNYKISLLDTPCGSPSYASPEMILGKRYNGIKVDYWSLGIVLYAMVFGSLPFEDDNDEVLFNKIVKQELIFKNNVKVSKEVKYVIKILLDKNPVSRACYNDIIKTKFYKEGMIQYNKVLTNYESIFLINKKMENLIKKAIIDVYKLSNYTLAMDNKYNYIRKNKSFNFKKIKKRNAICVNTSKSLYNLVNYNLSDDILNTNKIKYNSSLICYNNANKNIIYTNNIRNIDDNKYHNCNYEIITNSIKSIKNKYCLDYTYSEICNILLSFNLHEINTMFYLLYNKSIKDKYRKLKFDKYIKTNNTCNLNKKTSKFSKLNYIQQQSENIKNNSNCILLESCISDTSKNNFIKIEDILSVSNKNNDILSNIKSKIKLDIINNVSKTKYNNDNLIKSNYIKLKSKSCININYLNCYHNIQEINYNNNSKKYKSASPKYGKYKHISSNNNLIKHKNNIIKNTSSNDFEKHQSNLIINNLNDKVILDDINIKTLSKEAYLSLNTNFYNNFDINSNYNTIKENNYFNNRNSFKTLKNSVSIPKKFDKVYNNYLININYYYNYPEIKSIIIDNKNSNLNSSQIKKRNTIQNKIKKDSLSIKSKLSFLTDNTSQKSDTQNFMLKIKEINKNSNCMNKSQFSNKVCKLKSNFIHNQLKIDKNINNDFYDIEIKKKLDINSNNLLNINKDTFYNNNKISEELKHKYKNKLDNNFFIDFNVHKKNNLNLNNNTNNLSCLSPKFISFNKNNINDNFNINSSNLSKKINYIDYNLNYNNVNSSLHNNNNNYISKFSKECRTSELYGKKTKLNEYYNTNLESKFFDKKPMYTKIKEQKNMLESDFKKINKYFNTSKILPSNDSFYNAKSSNINLELNYKKKLLSTKISSNIAFDLNNLNDNNKKNNLKLLIN